MSVLKNLAGYLIPVNADVGRLEAYFVDEVDPHASALGAKGIGELGATGVAAAIANAVYHATGVRVRDLPIVPSGFSSRPAVGQLESLRKNPAAVVDRRAEC